MLLNKYPLFTVDFVITICSKFSFYNHSIFKGISEHNSMKPVSIGTRGYAFIQQLFGGGHCVGTLRISLINLPVRQKLGLHGSDIFFGHLQKLPRTTREQYIAIIPDFEHTSTHYQISAFLTGYNMLASIE